MKPHPIIYRGRGIKVYGAGGFTKEYYPKRSHWVNERIIDWGDDYLKHWADAIQEPDHPYNWAGVAFGIIYLLKTGKIGYSRKLANYFGSDWRVDLAQAAIMGQIVR